MELLYPLGYNLEIFDYRGYGRSTGSSSEAGLRTDARAVLAQLLTRPGVDPKRLVYYGWSLGGAVCIDLATATAPAVLITESTFTSIADLVKDGAYAGLPVSFVSDSRWTSIDKIPTIRAPYLAMHGLVDTFVQSKYSVELANAHQSAGPTKLLLVPGADHDTVPDKLGDAGYRQLVGDFVAQQLP